MHINNATRCGQLLTFPSANSSRWLLLGLLLGLFLLGCATTPKQTLTSDDILSESLSRQRIYEQETTKLDQSRRDGTITEDDYKEKTGILKKLDAKERRLQARINGHASSTEIDDLATDLTYALESAGRTGLKCLECIGMACLQMLAGLHN